VNKRLLAIGLALLAAGCFLFSAFSKRWLYNSADQDEFGFGLRSAWACGDYREGRECMEWGPSQYEELFYRAGVSGEKQKQTSAAFVPCGWVTFVGCLLAGLSLLVGAGLALGNKKPDLKIAPTTIAVLATAISLITGCIYVATKPGPGGVVGVGITFIVFGAGVVLAMASAPMLAKVNSPPDIDDY